MTSLVVGVDLFDRSRCGQSVLRYLSVDLESYYGGDVGGGVHAYLLLCPFDGLYLCRHSDFSLAYDDASQPQLFPLQLFLGVQYRPRLPL